jgi:SWI/SNF-related matrix-associated actin-dependent regulator of chromatin subfamily A-like protein 1
MSELPNIFDSKASQPKAPPIPLTYPQLHALCKRMSGRGAPNERDDAGWCKDTWDEGNELADMKELDREYAYQASLLLYKFSMTQLPDIAQSLGFKVDSEIMWMTRQSLKLNGLVFKDNYGERIALMGWYNPDAKDALKNALKFPKIAWTTQDKIPNWPEGNEAYGAWTIQNKPDVIAIAVSVLADFDIDFGHLDTEPTQVSDDSQAALKPHLPPSHESYIKDGGHHGGHHTGTPSPKKVDARYKATVNIDSVELKWPFLQNNADIRAAIKQVDGWKWDGEKKVWRIPLAQAAKCAEFVRPHSDELADAIINQPEIATSLEQTMERVKLSQAIEAPDIMVDDIKARLEGKFPDGCELYPFQYVGVGFVEAANGRAMIGDEMGIGKTMQAIAYSVLHTEQWPVLVVCPANVKYNWGAELAKWVPDASVCLIKDGKSMIEDADYTVINYDLVSKRRDELLANGYNLVILDESHYIKSEKAARTIATIDIAKQSTGLICLTGTPITNRPAEFFTQLNLLRPGRFANVWNYRKRYCAAVKTKFGWKYDGASNLPELNEQARDFMVRRLLEEVIPEMPDLVESFVPVEISDADWNTYNGLVADWQGQYEYYIDNPPMPQGFVLNMLTELRHHCGLLKCKYAAEYIDNYTTESDKPLVVFTHHRDVMDDIIEIVGSKINYGIIRGGTPPADRQRLVAEFQAGELDVLFCATVAAKEGITLTNADTVLFVEREWVPGWEAQAAARIRRIGQDSEYCNQIFLSVERSIDQHFDAVVKGKAAVLTAALDGDEEGRAKGDIVNQLLKKLAKDNNWRTKK